MGLQVHAKPAARTLLPMGVLEEEEKDDDDDESKRSGSSICEGAEAEEGSSGMSINSSMFLVTSMSESSSTTRS